MPFAATREDCCHRCLRKAATSRKSAICPLISARLPPLRFNFTYLELRAFLIIAVVLYDLSDYLRVDIQILYSAIADLSKLVCEYEGICLLVRLRAST